MTLNYKCCICLPIYNSEFGLPFVFKNILELNKIFLKIVVIIFYDESNDNSFDLINKFKNKNSFKIKIIYNKSKKFKLRTENIAYARNKMLDTINNEYEYEYFIMMDTNEYSCIGNINVDILKEALIKYPNYDSISFDREAGYYDTWALSFHPFIYSFFHFVDYKKVVKDMRKDFNKLIHIYKTKKNYSIIPVYSAFNGFAIYKRKSFLKCTYDSNINLNLFPKGSINNQINLINVKKKEDLSNDCEHRKFHLEAIFKNNAKIGIYPKSLFSKFINPPKNLRGPA